MSIVLKGTTWAHLRGLAPLVAASRDYCDRHPGLDIVWTTHTAREFGEGPLEPLAQQYDLICFDHPLTGHAAAHGLFLPLDEQLPANVLADRAAHSVGPSFASYSAFGHQWGLPVDAASFVAASRVDLLEARGHRVPETWAELLQLARETRAVGQGFSRMTTTAIFFTLCAQLGRPAFGGVDRGLDREASDEALSRLFELFGATGGVERLQQGSMELLAAAARRDSSVWHVPFTYGYCTFSRPGFVPGVLQFDPIVSAGGRRGAGGVVGGAGLAVSASSRHRAEALAVVESLTSETCQRGVYATCAGQPADRRAWTDPWCNQLCGGFFLRLLPAIESSWLRPNRPAFHTFQGAAATCLREYLLGASRHETWTKLHALARPVTAELGEAGV